jgi:hypothetical protein
MRRFGAGTMGRKGRRAGRPVASLLIAWVTMVALVIYQMPAFTGAAQAMPMPMSASAAALDVVAPCDDMGQATDQGRAGTSAMPDTGMPCCATTTPGSQTRGDHACPLMGGCFSMCASITPLAAEVQEVARVAEHTLFFDEVGTPHAIPPLQRPPKHL